MKRLLTITFVIVVGAICVVSVRLYRPVFLQDKSHRIEFPAFPIDQPQKVSFSRYSGETGGEQTARFREASYWNGYSNHSNGRREQLDQWRDWLLITVLSASNLPSSSVNKALYDLPPSRRSMLDRVGNYEFGETRSRILNGGEVIALIPASTDEQRLTYLAHVADEQRKNSGQIPSTFVVFEYTLDPQRQLATIVRRVGIDGQELFTGAVGYHERSLNSLGDLEQLMSEINDVTYARFEGSGLLVGGRLVPRYRGVGVEEVATLWQSEKNGLEGLRGSGFSLDPDFDPIMVRRNADALIAVLTALYKHAGLSDEANSPDPKWQVDLGEAVTLDKNAISDYLKEGKFDRYLQAAEYACARAADKEDCRRSLGRLANVLQIQKARYDGSLKGTEVGMTLFYTDLLMKLWSFDFQGTTPGRGEVSDFPNERDMNVARVYADETKKFPATRLWLGSLNKGFQIGPNRSEILLARVTTRVYAVPSDFLENKDVPDQTEPHVYDRTFMNWWNDHYEEVADYEKEYQRLNEIMKWSQIVGWLNSQDGSHRLEFLNDVPPCGQMSDRKCIKRDNWFPDWVKEHDSELTYHCWPFSATRTACLHSPESEAGGLQSSDINVNVFGARTLFHIRKERPDAIHFYPRGYAGLDVEILPLLESAPFQDFGNHLIPASASTDARSRNLNNVLEMLGVTHFWSGGVSLAEREAIASRPALTEEVEMAARRGNLNYSESDIAAGKFKTLEKVEYDVANLSERGVFDTIAKPDASARLRGLIGEFKNESFETSLSRSPEEVVVSVKNGNTTLGELRIHHAKDTFNIGWVSRDMDDAQILARKVSQAPDIEAALSKDQLVRMWVRSRSDTYFIRTGNSGRWLKMSFATDNDSAIPAGFDARIAGFDTESKSVDIALLSEKDVAAELPSDGFLEVPPDGAATSRSEIPTSETHQVRREYLGQTVDLLVDDSGRIFASIKNLPADLRFDPDKLRQLARGNIEPGVLQEPAVAQDLETGRFRSIADQLARDPNSVRSGIDRVVSSRIKQYDELAMRDPDAAVLYLDRIRLEFGDLPDIRIRHALAELEGGDGQGAAETIGRLEGRVIENSQQFLDEIRQRIVAGRGDPQSLEQLDGYVNWKESGHENSGSLLALSREDHFYTEYRISRIDRQAVDVDRVFDEQRPAIFYVQDSPGLNNLDPYSPAGRRTVESLVQSGKIKIERAVDVDLAHFKPGIVLDEQTGKSLRLVRVPHLYVPVVTNQDCNTSKTDCQQQVYIVTLPNAAA